MAKEYIAFALPPYTPHDLSGQPIPDGKVYFFEDEEFTTKKNVYQKLWKDLFEDVFSKKQLGKHDILSVCTLVKLKSQCAELNQIESLATPAATFPTLPFTPNSTREV